MKQAAHPRPVFLEVPLPRDEVESKQRDSDCHNKLTASDKLCTGRPTEDK